MVDLTNYNAIRTALFVRLEVAEYRTSPNDAFTSEVLTFSDHNALYSINGETYTNIGNLLSISSSTSEIRATPDSLNITISGIPIQPNLYEIVNSKIKSSPIDVYRAYFNVLDNQVGDVQGRFSGFVNNYSLNEDIDFESRDGTISITLECTNNVGILGNKVSGRKTNPVSMKKFYSTDTSFDNVPTLEGTTFVFGGSQ